jgi:hypothetical protein
MADPCKPSTDSTGKPVVGEKLPDLSLSFFCSSPSCFKAVLFQISISVDKVYVTVFLCIYKYIGLFSHVCGWDFDMIKGSLTIFFWMTGGEAYKMRWEDYYGPLGWCNEDPVKQDKAEGWQDQTIMQQGQEKEKQKLRALCPCHLDNVAGE